MDKCDICCRNILIHAKHIQCSICQNMYHMKCLTLSQEYKEELQLQASTRSWYCSRCIADIFPFSHIENDIDFINAVTVSSGKDSLCYLSDKIFLPFELNDKEHSINLCDADPDLNYYNSINMHITKCNYYLEQRSIMLLVPRA